MRRLRLAVVLGGCTAAAVIASLHLWGQSTPPPNVSVPTPVYHLADGRSSDPILRMPTIAELQMKRIVEEDRRKRISQDTTKLLQLATELKNLMDKTSKDQMSLEVIRKADQIEKVAHDLKQRMST